MRSMDSLRSDVKLEILADPKRKVIVDHKVRTCEGQGFEAHICAGGFEMNEVLFPRNVFQKVPPVDQRYFYHPINCSINCTLFHAAYGHSKEYRRWFHFRMQAIYGADRVATWIKSAPLIDKTPKSASLAPADATTSDGSPSTQ